MKQTAVDYIKEKLMCNDYWYENMTFDQIIEQAKEMEKKQIVDAYVYGSAYGIDFDKGLSPINYYKETYESND
jgi:hypothetical protein